MMLVVFVLGTCTYNVLSMETFGFLTSSVHCAEHAMRNPCMYLVSNSLTSSEAMFRS